MQLSVGILSHRAFSGLVPPGRKLTQLDIWNDRTPSRYVHRLQVSDQHRPEKWAPAGDGSSLPQTLIRVCPGRRQPEMAE